MRNLAGFKTLPALAKVGVILAAATMVGVGRAAGDDGRASLPGDQKIEGETIRNAVVRALPSLIKASAKEYPKHRECFSCHNQAVLAVGLTSRKSAASTSAPLH